MMQISSLALPEIGSFALLLALALSVYCFFAGVSRWPEERVWNAWAKPPGARVSPPLLAVFLAAVVLVTAAFNDDFSIAYLFHHSNRDLPLPYKFAVLWSGQEGSLLFWSLLLATYGLVLRLRYKTTSACSAKRVHCTRSVQVFFLLLLNFAAHPFAIMQGQVPQDGSGRIPFLQYPKWYPSPCSTWATWA